MGKKILIFVFFVFMLTGCNWHKIDRGVVLEKRITPEHTVYLYNAALKMPMPHRVPASYQLIARDGDIIETFNVSEKVYYSVSVGDSLKFND